MFFLVLVPRKVTIAFFDVIWAQVKRGHVCGEKRSGVATVVHKMLCIGTPILLVVVIRFEKDGSGSLVL